MTEIRGGLVYGPDFRFHKEDVFIRDGRFCERAEAAVDAERADAEDAAGAQAGSDAYEPGSARDAAGVLDASDCYVIPGLMDIHFHGCMGQDFCDGTPEAVRTLAEYEAREGITAICPATLTLPPEELKHILRNGAGAAAGKRTPERADLVGINMEGPFISMQKKGAQNGAYILPCDADLCQEFIDASDGLVKIIGLAPEANPGFEAFIGQVRGRVRVSLAHTNADYETAMAAFRAGASHAVHLFNAMPEMTHRAPGVVGAVRDSAHVSAELICDGNHVHPSVVRAAFDMLGPERIVLISDSLRAAGMGDGRMDLGGQVVEVHGTRATLAEGGNLAGSVVNLMQCLQIAVLEMQIPLEDAVRCAACNPARVIGADGAYGSIRPGLHANAVLLDRGSLRVRAVIKDGVRIR